MASSCIWTWGLVALATGVPGCSKGRDCCSQVTMHSISCAGQAETICAGCIYITAYKKVNHVTLSRIYIHCDTVMLAM